jgi:hypothetical protein
MQGPTHLIAGVLIQKAMRKIRPLPLQYFLIAFLAIISHGILDGLARLTYHPSKPLADDSFWVSYHTVLAFLVIFIFVKYWKRYKLGLIFSVLPDLDWIVIHSSELFSFRISFWKRPIMHESLFSFLDSLPPLSFLNTLPDWSLERKGIILELALLIILITVLHIVEKESKLERRKNQEHEKAIPSRDWIKILPFYQTCMDHEQMIRMTYQGLLTTLEVGLFGLFFALKGKEYSSLWLLSAVGIFLCIVFGIPCEFRARNVDIWRIQIVKLVSGTEVEDAFKKGKYRWIPFGKAGSWLSDYLFAHWFEKILIPLIYLGWLFTLWYLPSPRPIRLCALPVVLGWILWAFSLKELRGSYHDYK